MDHRLASLAFAAISIPALLARDDFPIIPDDLEVSLYAREPLVRNPCAIVFDAQGRLCVGMGPQYRKPTPETPGDSVWILIDADGDGTADSRKRYATGFNSIQGLAWRGRDLYVANAPELTIARDLDGDDDLEIVYGPRAYHHDGSMIYSVPVDANDYHFAQVADLDGDGEPEVIGL